MITSKISLILTAIITILVDFVQSVVEMHWDLFIALHEGTDHYVLRYPSATRNIRRYIHYMYRCMVFSIRTGRAGYLKRVRELERYTADMLLDHLFSWHLVYLFISIYLFAGIFVFSR